MADAKDIKKHSLIRNAKGRLVSQANVDEIVTLASEMEFQEAKEAGALGFAAHCMTVCTLPHSKLVGPDGKTELREYVRHNGRTHLAIQAGPAVMPGTGISYGAYPRLGLIYLASRAKTSNSKEIELGASLSDFLKRLGIHVTGGKRGGITAANAQLFRLFTSSMMAWEDAGKGQLPWDSFDPFRLVERREIWWNPMAPDQPSLWKNTLVLTDRAFHELTQNAVPIDLRGLQIKEIHGSAMALDFYTWLPYRGYTAKRRTEIPWGLLKRQLGAGYPDTPRGLRDFRANARKAIAAVLTFHRDLKVDASDEDSLVISPSRKKGYLADKPAD
jgi:hypothetical protein